MPNLALELRVVDAPSLRIALAGLTAMNAAIIARGGIRPLYRARVRYRSEAPDVWSTCDIVQARGYGDCEDLAAWRAAELRATGEDPRARADVYSTGPARWHCVVVRGSGAVEDPSRRLGMGRR